MNLSEKIAKIETDIQNGLKFKATDRFRNLINHNPNELSLRERLAEIYYESGFLDMAGRYWILTEPKTERIKKCVEIYEKSVNYSGTKILQDIIFRGKKENLTEYAQNKLNNLELDSKKKTNYIPKFNPITNKQQRKKKTNNRTLKDKIIEKIFLAVLISIPILAIIGLIKVIGWIF